MSVDERSKADQMRDLLAQVDDHQRMARAAESIRVKMRCLAPVAVRRGVLGWLRWTNEPKGHYEFEELDGALNAAVYEALGDVRQEHLRRAREVEESIR